MKKLFTLMLAVIMALTLLAGCSKKAVCTLTVNNDNHYTLAQDPELSNKVTYGWQWEEGRDGEQSHGTLTSKGDCTFTFVLEERGSEEKFTIVIECKGGKAEIKDNGGLEIELKK